MFLLRLRRCTLATIPPPLQAAALFKRTFFFAWDAPGTSLFHTTNNWISLNLRSTTGIIPLQQHDGGKCTAAIRTRGPWRLLLELNIPIFRRSTVEALLPLHLHTLCIYGGAAEKTPSSEHQYCEKQRNISTALEKIDEGGGVEGCRRIQPGSKNPSEKTQESGKKSDEPAPNLTGLKRQTLLGFAEPITRVFWSSTPQTSPQVAP